MSKDQERGPVETPDTVVETLEGMMHTVEVKSWIAVGTIVLLLGAVLVWGFFGTLQLREDVSGVLVRSGKTLDIYAKTGGAVLDVTVSTGDTVRKDQVLVRLEQTALVDRVNMLIAGGASEAEIDIARRELINASQVMTYQAGRLADIYVEPGDIVAVGDRLATVYTGADVDKGLECLLFVPLDQMKSIEKGQFVNVYPAGIKTKTYGNMTGTVVFISEYPVTERYLYQLLGSEELAKSFMRETACYEVALVLDVSEDTATGFAWTTSMGPAKPFGDLTNCDAAIVVDKLRPIDVFLGQ